MKVMTALPAHMYEFLFVKFGDRRYEPTWKVEIRRESDTGDTDSAVWNRFYVPDRYVCECRCGGSFKLAQIDGRVMRRQFNASDDGAVGIMAADCVSRFDEPPCGHWKPVYDSREVWS